MVLKNGSFKDFFAEVQGKRIVAFGASKYCEVFCKQFSYLKLEKKIYCLSDNNSALHHTVRKLNETEVSVLPLEEAMGESGEVVILITSTVYAYEIYTGLHADPVLEQVVCYVLPLLVYQTRLEKARDAAPYIRNRKDKQRIPKKIHCCWFSGDEKPGLYQKCIDSWKVYCPDYEIIEWNQDNYDVTKNLYMRQALEARKWAFVSDYARLDLVYTYGGIYMDMDMELVSSLDSVLGHKAYFSFDCYNCVEMGASFGAEPGLPILKTMMKQYETIPFVNEQGGFNLAPQPIHMVNSFKAAGLKLDGCFQVIDEMAFYPIEYFCPIDFDMGLSVVEKAVIGIHHFGDSWFASDKMNEKRRKTESLQSLYKLAEK